MHVTVRRASAQDWPAMRQIFLLGRQRAFFWLDAAQFRRGDLDAQTRGELLWVAVDAAQHVVGFVSLWEPSCFIHHLYVDPAHCRQGVGLALLEALPGWGRVRYTLKCLRRNTPALAFYAACGFTDAGLGDDPECEHVVLGAPTTS